MMGRGKGIDNDWVLTALLISTAYSIPAMSIINKAKLLQSVHHYKIRSAFLTRR